MHRFFECIIHIAYRLEFKTWRKPANAIEKKKIYERKAKKHSDFRKKMGLGIDMPKTGSSGSTNDGNTARRAFRNPNLYSEITGVEKELIIRLRIILLVINLNHKISIASFIIYLRETAEFHVRIYKWFYMPVSLHKILVHGHLIISSFSLPIGIYSEEAQESRNTNQ